MKSMWGRSDEFEMFYGHQCQPGPAGIRLKAMWPDQKTLAALFVFFFPGTFEGELNAIYCKMA
jgi:hypothetical protein